MNTTLTNSRMSLFRRCPHACHLRYDLGLVPERDGEAARIGTLFHRVREELDRNPESRNEPIATLLRRLAPDEVDAYMLSTVCAMVVAHAERWGAEACFDVVATELRFDLALDDTFGVSGLVDRVLRRRSDGRLFLSDYKTTTEDTSPGSDYWIRLSLDHQLAIYTIALRSLGHDIHHIVYDVVPRPQHRPHRATPVDKIRFTKNGRPYANVRTRDESPDEFGVRILESMRERRDDMVRHEMSWTEGELERVVDEVRKQAHAMQSAYRGGFYRNPSACLVPFRCSYLPICRQDLTNQSPAPSGFVKLTDASELATRGASPARS